jgi:hypothetical protein
MEGRQLGTGSVEHIGHKVGVAFWRGAAAQGPRIKVFIKEGEVVK